MFCGVQCPSLPVIHSQKFIMRCTVTVLVVCFQQAEPYLVHALIVRNSIAVSDVDNAV